MSFKSKRRAVFASVLKLADPDWDKLPSGKPTDEIIVWILLATRNQIHNSCDTYAHCDWTVAALVLAHS